LIKVGEKKQLDTQAIRNQKSERNIQESDIDCLLLAFTMLNKISLAYLIIFIVRGHAFSLDGRNSDRRSFLSNVASASITTGGAAAIGVGGFSMPAVAAPEIFTLKSGIKYAITKPSEKGQYPEAGDIVAIEYTGYLVNGQVCGM